MTARQVRSGRVAAGHTALLRAQAALPSKQILVNTTESRMWPGVGGFGESMQVLGHQNVPEPSVPRIEHQETHHALKTCIGNVHFLELLATCMTHLLFPNALHLQVGMELEGWAGSNLQATHGQAPHD